MIRPIIAGVVVVLVGAACAADEPTEVTDRTTAASAPAPTQTTVASAPNAVDGSTTTSVETISPSTSTTTSTAPTTTSSTLVPTTTTTVVREKPTPFAVSADVPDIEMFDAATGARVNLRTVVKGEKPLMLWFWSPF